LFSFIGGDKDLSIDSNQEQIDNLGFNLTSKIHSNNKNNINNNRLSNVSTLPDDLGFNITPTQTPGKQKWTTK
jgi:hypothetical protein